MKYYRPLSEDAKILIIDHEGARELYEQFKRDLDALQKEEKWADPLYTEIGPCCKCESQYECVYGDRSSIEFCSHFDDRPFSEQMKARKEYEAKHAALHGRERKSPLEEAFAELEQEKRN